MATANIRASRGTIPQHLLNDLAAHSYAMDGETAVLLHKIDGVMTLVMNSFYGIGTDEPVPAGVLNSLWATQDLLHKAMARGGIKSAGENS